VQQIGALTELFAGLEEQFGALEELFIGLKEQFATLSELFAGDGDAICEQVYDDFSAREPLTTETQSTTEPLRICKRRSRRADSSGVSVVS
jgi:hypothetical protein